MQDSKITVSVLIPTYNHENFIEECLVGVLSQKCNFNVEVIVTDDCSPDKTEQIVTRIINEHPNGSWIKYIRHSKNKGAVENALWTLRQPIGEYIAFCEGDDYWVDTMKLQLEFDLLNSNSSLSMVSTGARNLVNGELVSFHNQLPPNQLKLKEYLMGHYKFATCTVLVRKNIVQETADLLTTRSGDFFHVDYLMWCVAGKYGSLAFIDRPTAVYRIHENSFMRITNQRVTLKTGMVLNKFLAEYLGKEFKTHFLGNNWWYYLEYAFVELEDRKILTSFVFLSRALFESIIWGKSNQLQIIRDYGYRLRNRKTGAN